MAHDSDDARSMESGDHLRDANEEQNAEDSSGGLPKKPTTDYLLRLLESKHFVMSMAITYLFKSKEPGVQSYIGTLNITFRFPRNLVTVVNK